MSLENSLRNFNKCSEVILSILLSCKCLTVVMRESSLEIGIIFNVKKTTRHYFLVLKKKFFFFNCIIIYNIHVYKTVSIVVCITVY